MVLVSVFVVAFSDLEYLAQAIFEKWENPNLRIVELIGVAGCISRNHLHRLCVLSANSPVEQPGTEDLGCSMSL